MKKFGNTFVIFLMLIMFDAQALSQGKSLQKVFAPVSKESRANLIERLRLLTQYERMQQRDKSYDLLFGDEIEGRTKEEYVKWKRKILGRNDNWFRDFIPKSVDQEVNEYPQADYRIVGTVKLKDDNNRIRIVQGWVYARQQNGEWYFSSFDYVLCTFW